MPNGAQADAKIIPVKTGESYTIPSGLFTRKGYTFVGWAKTPDAVRADYTNGTAVSDLTDAGKTIKLYAIWKRMMEASIKQISSMMKACLPETLRSKGRMEQDIVMLIQTPNMQTLIRQMLPDILQIGIDKDNSRKSSFCCYDKNG